MAFRRLTAAEMAKVAPYVLWDPNGADLTFRCLCGRERWFGGWLGTLEEERVDCPDSTYLHGDWEWHQKGCGRSYRLRLEVEE